jgi:hypothetical protein
MRTFVVVVVLAGVAAVALPALGANRMPMPPLAPVERGEYRARDVRTGAELWRTRWVLREDRGAGRPILHLVEEGERLGESIVPATWSVRMLLDLWGAAPRMSSVREGRDTGGALQQSERREFDYGAGSGTITTTDQATGQSERHVVPLTPHAVTGELLPAALRLLPGAADRQMRLELVTRGGYVLKLRAKVTGREWVEVPAGRFDCLKIALDLQGFVGFMAGMILPDLLMWHTAEPPHFWVKYQGPEGGLGSREIVRELVAFEPQPWQPTAQSPLPSGRADR